MTASPPVASSADARGERTIAVPLARLFFPEPDPTEKFSGHSAEVGGYVVAPGPTLTVAVASELPRGPELLDEVWATIRHRGVGVRRISLIDERDRALAVMTVKLDVPDSLLRTLRRTLVVPVQTSGGFAEVQLLATEEEESQIESALEGTPSAPPGSPQGGRPPVRPTAGLDTESWAFLGLLNAIGAFSDERSHSPTLLAEFVGTDVRTFLDRARALEHDLEGLVTELFAPESPAHPPSAAAG